ncbi:adenylate kinase ADK2 NDAI_0B02260 [Naumovozyma dairenensis CBS 421]|uniref:GTP:AMP phosphotransferase, mitochondrial n=1 Tax=Naumovozyma dairenensis (strain ATCC 10597 / BCRC 20456 / CBS 421 / NBRC 0211 / NRRL Y-12639) TaxID=1071378 RepID=G0W650_NAUDC|nr:hypothetical protein NDAI_0B02260 [Naumovozyma dairenensis CBS 421]CCD23261.1 hypothetical protein NDAI_0B02260 [Naumovozyma dairenensis CBS 421]
MRDKVASIATPIRLVLLGPPGSGKGTQTKKLMNLIPQFDHISSGELLRQQINANTKLGQIASKYIHEGKLIPDDLITKLLTNRLFNPLSPNSNNSNSKWILDGFPRTIIQAEHLDRTLLQNQTMLDLVVELNVPDSIILGRIEERYIHPSSGRVYNLKYNPPKVPGRDDVTGERLVKRVDDTLAAFKERIKTYHETADPLKEYYDKQGVLSTLSGETSDIIFPKLVSLLNSKFGLKLETSS